MKCKLLGEKKNLDKKEQTNSNQRRRRQKIQDRVHPFSFFFFAMLTFLVKIIIFYTRIENIYIFTPLLLRLDTRAQFTCSSNIIAEEQRDLNSLEKIQNDFLSLYRSLLTHLNPNRYQHLICPNDITT